MNVKLVNEVIVNQLKSRIRKVGRKIHAAKIGLFSDLDPKYWHELLIDIALLYILSKEETRAVAEPYKATAGWSKRLICRLNKDKPVWEEYVRLFWDLPPQARTVLVQTLSHLYVDIVQEVQFPMPLREGFLGFLLFMDSQLDGALDAEEIFADLRSTTCPAHWRTTLAWVVLPRTSFLGSVPSRYWGDVYLGDTPDSFLLLAVFYGLCKPPIQRRQAIDVLSNIHDELDSEAQPTIFEDALDTLILSFRNAKDIEWLDSHISGLPPWVQKYL